LGGTKTPSNGLSITRNVGATWFLTSQSEWYKAAYYQPAGKGGDVDDYWLYATGTNSDPTIATANGVGDISNPGPNVVNYNDGAVWNSLTGNVTTVGSAGPLSQSFYGTSDQAGNVYEWNEKLLGVPGSFRELRGGAYNSPGASFVDSGIIWFAPSNENSISGFRVATIAIPEPSTYVMAAMGIVALLFARRQMGR